jgi:hypothetical protein
VAVLAVDGVGVAANRGGQRKEDEQISGFHHMASQFTNHTRRLPSLPMQWTVLYTG